MDSETNPFQENMERSARVSSLLLLTSPPTSASVGFIAVLGAVTGVLLGATPTTVGQGLLVVALPAFVAAFATTGVADALGGSLYLRRSAFLAAAGAGVVSLAVVARLAMGVVGVSLGIVPVLFLGLAFQLAARHAVLSVISDHRHVRSLAAASVQPLLTLPVLWYLYGVDPASWGPGFVLWFVVLVPSVLVQTLFDAPMSRNFGVSATQVFRHYLDHITTGSETAEDLIGRLGEPADVPVSVVALRRLDGSPKACIVVPVLHPGPFGALGGGDLPRKVAEALPDWPVVLVPHAAASHDLNPVSTAEVERLAVEAAELAGTIDTKAGGSALFTAGATVQVSAQAFGADVLLTYTSWPEAIDDVDYGVGHAAELQAARAGFKHAVFVDCHNSLRPGAGAVFACQPRAHAIEAHARDAAAQAHELRSEQMRAGVAQDTTSLGAEHLVGTQGCQALVVECGGATTAYVLWDANNMLPEATEAVRRAVLEIVDACQVMTTDNHSVNVAGTFSPLGARVAHDDLARVARATVDAAIADMEPVTSGIGQRVVPDVKVFGHQKTAQLAASVNTMTSVLPELIVACILMWVAGIWLVFLLL